jgi:hypothetical protein
MLAKLMGKDGGVKPIERKIAAMHQFNEGIEHSGLLAGLVTKTVMVPALDQAQGFHFAGLGR